MSSITLPDSEAVTAAIKSFRTFLNMVWPIIDEILEDHDWDNDAYFLEDWLDANWRLLVGRQLLGKGADFQPFSIATNEIKKNWHEYRLELEANDLKIFVTLGSDQKGFIIAPPFDKVKVINSNGIMEILDWSTSTFKISRQKQHEATNGRRV